MTALKGYRTVIVNAVTSIVGLLLAVDWVTLGLTPARAGGVMLGLGVVNILLRVVTDTAISAKE